MVAAGGELPLDERFQFVSKRHVHVPPFRFVVSVVGCLSSLRLEATAFGRATLEGSADPARCFRPCDLGPPSVSTPAGQGRGGRAGGGVETIRRAGQRSRWETDPAESVRVR